MKNSALFKVCIVVLIIFLGGSESGADISAPILKWQHGGCYSSWCETGWYSSPAVADLDGDGNIEVIGAAYSIFVINGVDGSLKWSVNPDGSRVWPGVVVADLDENGDLEIVTAHGDGYVHVFDHEGGTVWSRQPVTHEMRSLSVSDLDGDGDMEIVVGSARGGNYDNIYVYEHNADLRPGWPQLSSGCCAYGIYNDNLAIADIDGDGKGEIVAPSDVHYICAFNDDGTRIQSNSQYGDKKWGEVGVWVDLEAELRGWGYCGTEHRPNFCHCPAAISDVNGDTIPEVVVVGNIHNCGTSPYTNLYHGPYIFNPDRSRFVANGFDWETVPIDVGAPICESYSIIESCMPNPVVVDLDRNGFKEILFASNDGKVHCFWLDKTEHHNWPYSVYNPAEGIYRFASEPVVADLDNNGYPEVIFASWVQKGSSKTGKVHILDYQGNPLHEVALPPAFGSPDWNGALPAPTLADIDGDPDLELVLNTAHSGLVAYDLPNTADARILWGTGRGSYQRTGSFAIEPCAGDFDKDGDIDGNDLASFVAGGTGISLEIFSTNFGMSNCP
ncbi:MAG: VCBS repeat-containing protein [Desulfobacula sp.]|uniref:FG-GAP repeat domain-containing protein n=1 Tax=Desulfobacula sp. TaxID=2593537 RepID=UPI0025BC01E4|nr:VCBS repeat-containing protein [Desulfobacula sp.]MCD4722633.1 VCBS repeat-containing protein [Desulfobacula sp.]